MGKKEDKKRLLAQVEEAKQEYLHTCDVADECYGRLDHQREEAISTMEQSEGLINSIKHTPFSFKKDLKALSFLFTVRAEHLSVIICTTHSLTCKSSTASQELSP